MLAALRTKDACELAQRALEAARQHKERGHEAWALHLLGEVAARGDALDVGAATDYYAEALALAGGLGMQPLAIQCQGRLDEIRDLDITGRRLR